MSDREEEPAAGSGDDDSNGESGSEEGNSDDEPLLVPTQGGEAASQQPRKRRKKRRDDSPSRKGAELGRELQMLQLDKTIRLQLTMDQARDFSLLELTDGPPPHQQESADASQSVDTDSRVGRMQAIIARFQEEARRKGRGQVKKKTKDGQAHMDQYDSDDSWIDDSEMADEVDTVATKYGGFYICKGHIEDAEPSSSDDEPREDNSDGDFAQVEVHRSKKGKQQLTLSRKRRESVSQKQKPAKKAKKAPEQEVKVAKKRPKKTAEEEVPNKKTAAQEEGKASKRKKKRVEDDEAPPKKRKATGEPGPPKPKKQKVDAPSKPSQVADQDKEVPQPPPPTPQANGELQPVGKARLNFKKSAKPPAPASKQPPTGNPPTPQPSAPRAASTLPATSTSTAPERPPVLAPPPMPSAVSSDDDKPLLARPKPKSSPPPAPAAPKAPEPPASDPQAKPKKPRKPRTPKTDTQGGDAEKKPAKPRQSKKAGQQGGQPASTPAAPASQGVPNAQAQTEAAAQAQFPAQAQAQAAVLDPSDGAGKVQALVPPNVRELQEAIKTSAQSVFQWVDCHDPGVPLDEDGQYMVHFLALAEGNLVKQSLDYLKQEGMHLSAKDKMGNTALHTAVRRDKIKTGTLKALLPCVDVDAQNNEGDTCLHVAVRRGKVKTAKIILEAGADPTIQNNEGKVPLDYAFAIGGDGMQELVKLLFHSAATNSATKRRTPPTTSGPSSPINPVPATSPKPPATDPTPTKPATVSTKEPKKRKWTKKKPSPPPSPTEEPEPAPTMEAPDTDSGEAQPEADGEGMDVKQPQVKQLTSEVSAGVRSVLDGIQLHAANRGPGKLDPHMVSLLVDLDALLDTEEVKGLRRKEIMDHVEAITGAKTSSIKYKVDEAKAQRSIEPMKARLSAMLAQGSATVHDNGEAEFDGATTKLLVDMTELKFRSHCRHKGRKAARGKVQQFFKELVGELWPGNKVILDQLLDLTASIHANPPAAQQDGTPLKDEPDTEVVSDEA